MLALPGGYIGDRVQRKPLLFLFAVIGDTLIWQGERWLSAAHSNASCASLCMPCSVEQPGGYIKGHDFSYWVPLEFDAAGAVQQFKPFVESWALALPPTTRTAAGQAG